MDKLSKYYATMIADAMDIHLTVSPSLASKSTIKKLRGKQKADYRLRVDDYRVFYNVDEREKCVFVLRVMHKDQTKDFYKEVSP